MEKTFRDGFASLVLFFSPNPYEWLVRELALGAGVDSRAESFDSDLSDKVRNSLQTM